jgi:DNA polymerase
MDSLTQIAHQVSECTDCPLNLNRTNAVAGEGPEKAEIMMIGEAPGYNEDQQGRPFIGAAGKLLDQLLRSINMRRENVFITNTVKCRPNNNRDPLLKEMAACRKYLDRQIDLISPKVIVTLGRHAMSAFLPGEKISTARGNAREINGRLIFPIYHPAAALRQNNFRQLLNDDIQKLPPLIESISSHRPEVTASQSQQLSMF